VIDTCPECRLHTSAAIIDRYGECMACHGSKEKSAKWWRDDSGSHMCPVCKERPPYRAQRTPGMCMPCTIDKDKRRPAHKTLAQTRKLAAQKRMTPAELVRRTGCSLYFAEREMSPVKAIADASTNGLWDYTLAELQSAYRYITGHAPVPLDGRREYTRGNMITLIIRSRKSC